MSPSSPKYSPTSPASPSSPKYCKHLTRRSASPTNHVLQPLLPLPTLQHVRISTIITTCYSVLITLYPVAPAYCKLPLVISLSGTDSLIFYSANFSCLQPYVATVVAVESGSKRDKLYSKLFVHRFAVVGFLGAWWPSSLNFFLSCISLSDLVIMLLPVVKIPVAGH